MLMVQSKYRLCELFGIPIFVDISFAVLLLIFATSQSSLTGGLAWALALAVSVVLHELGHSLTARAFGYQTRDITISLLGGCASLTAMPKKAMQEFLTAIAGPAVSFALAIGSVLAMGFVATDGSALALLWHILTRTVKVGAVGHVVLFVSGDEAIFTCGDAAYRLVDLLIDFGCMNAMLGAFNLLPGFPMDGGRIFRSVMRAFMSRPKATFIAMWVGRAFAILLGMSGLVAVFNGGNWGFVRILIAWMIWREGMREYRMSLQDERWTSWSQGDFNARVSPPPYDL